MHILRIDKDVMVHGHMLGSSLRVCKSVGRHQQLVGSMNKLTVLFSKSFKPILRIRIFSYNPNRRMEERNSMCTSLRKKLEEKVLIATTILQHKAVVNVAKKK